MLKRDFFHFAEVVPKWVLALVAASAVVLSGGSLAGEYQFSSSVKTDLPSEIVALNDSVYPLLPIAPHGSQLVDRSAKQVRYWGGVFRVTNQLLELDLSEKELLVNRLQQIGFNQVRIIGLDFEDPGIYKDWQKTGNFPQPKMQSFCQLTELLKKRGFVYSIDLNHISGKYSHITNKKNRFSKSNKKYNHVQFFDAGIIGQTENWFGAFLVEKHPGCGTPYAADPAFVYINVVNEDSLFNGYFKDFKRLSKDNLSALNRLYNKRIGTNEELCYPGEANAKNEYCASTVNFLIDLEKEFFERIYSAIRETGYQGSITTTNNWYGVFNRDVNHDLGDAMNTHVYFSPMRTKKVLGNKYSAIKNVSFLSDPSNYRGWDKEHVYRLPAVLVPDKPLFVSEWNHSAWSDYLYEGPILLTGLAMQQGVSIMTVHSLLDRWLGTSAEVATTPYSVFGNPVLYAMLPSLAAAFREYQHPQGQILKSKAFNTDVDDYAAAIAQGMKPLSDMERKRVAKVFASPVRRTEDKATVWEGVADDESGLIAWHNDYEALYLATENFSALVGNTSEPVSITEWMSVSFDDPGAALFVSMDGEKLEDSRKILVTTVSGFDQGDEITRLGFGNKAYKVVTELGDGPQYLENHKIKLAVDSSLRGMVTIRPIYQAERSIDDQPIKRVSGDDFIIGAQKTPWYVIAINSD